jgi:hypothetical protein
LRRKPVETVAIALDFKPMKRTVYNRHVDPRRIAAKFLQNKVIILVWKDGFQLLKQSPPDVRVTKHGLGFFRTSHSSHP